MIKHGLEHYPFEKNDFLFYFQNIRKEKGSKAFYQFLNRPNLRPYSRALIKFFAPKGIGLEVGVGAKTIAPTERTVLSDAFSSHGVSQTIAKVFFKGSEILYPDETFSFILSEHVLEHLTNPIAALKEWTRVLEPQGKIFLFLPHRDRNMDRYRKLTTLEHLIDDYKKDVAINDDAHFQDWWDQVVLKGLFPEHYQHLDRQQLLDSGSIHQHVWTEVEIIELLEYLGLKVVYQDPQVYDRRDSFVVIASKE